jgi:hypothetical protein
VGPSRTACNSRKHLCNLLILSTLILAHTEIRATSNPSVSDFGDGPPGPFMLSSEPNPIVGQKVFGTVQLGRDLLTGRTEVDECYLPA